MLKIKMQRTTPSSLQDLPRPHPLFKIYLETLAVRGSFCGKNRKYTSRSLAKTRGIGTPSRCSSTRSRTCS
ncbi:hypothetical protein Csa_012638 [Cucumis sativus]|nr:hypothetical protein Csa_012638 [Cucumis sativus]